MKREEDLLRKTLHCRCRLQPRYATAVQFCEEVQTIASKVPSSRGWVGGLNFRGTVDQQYFPQLACSFNSHDLMHEVCVKPAMGFYLSGYRLS